MITQRFAETLHNVKYKDWQFFLGHSGDTVYLQIRFWALNNDTGAMEYQHCRKWLLSPHMTKSEIVLTAWKAVQAAEEHEAREKFTYRDARIFGPHIDVEALVHVSEAIDARTAKP